MSLVFQQLDHLRQRRTELETDRDATVRVLDHFDEAEKRQDRQARLASVLQSHLRAWPGGGRCSTPRATGQLDLADSHHSEDVSFWPSGIPEASRRDPSHAAEADVAWDLRKISLRVEGAEGLLERIRDDWRLILKAMAQVHSQPPPSSPPAGSTRQADQIGIVRCPIEPRALHQCRQARARVAAQAGALPAGARAVPPRRSRSRLC